MTRTPARVRVAWSIGPTGHDAATTLLRAEVGLVTGLQPEEVRIGRLCPRCGSSEHGRPVVVRRDGEPVPSVSLSRADAAVLVAVSGAGPVGVDLERIDAARFAGFTDVALHAGEHAPGIAQQAVTWVRKESLLKATGEALHVDPRSIRVSDAGEAPRLVDWSGRPDLPPTRMRDLEIPGHAACLTVLTVDAPEVTIRQAAPGDLSA